MLTKIILSLRKLVRSKPDQQDRLLQPCVTQYHKKEETMKMQFLAYFDSLFYYFNVRSFKMLFLVLALPKLKIGTKKQY